MAFIQAHLSVILSCLLVVSELLALLVPSVGGIMAGIVKGLKALGAKDPSEQLPQG